MKLLMETAVAAQPKRQTVDKGFCESSAGVALQRLVYAEQQTSASLETPKQKVYTFFHFCRGAIAPRIPP